MFKNVNNYLNTSCGTCRSDRGFPLDLQDSTLSLEVGKSDWRFKQGVYAYAWQDSAHCQCLSTYHPPEVTTVQRRVQGHNGKVDCEAPVAFRDYNLGMGGNDVGDMLRSRISVHSTSKKWWHGIFCYIEDQSHISTFRAWNHLVPSKKLSSRQVVEQIFLGLTGDTSRLITSDPCVSALKLGSSNPNLLLLGKRSVRVNPNVIDQNDSKMQNTCQDTI